MRFDFQLKNFILFTKVVANDYPKRFILLMFFILISTAFELLGFATLIPIIGTLVDPEYINSDNYRYVSGIFDYLGVSPDIENLLLLLVLIFAIKGIFVYFSVYYQEKIRIDTYMDMRAEMYEKIFRARWPFFIKKQVGELNNVIITQTRNAAIGIKHLAQFFVSIIFVFALLTVSLTISWKVVLLSMLFSGIVFGLMSVVFKASHSLGKRIGLNENSINQVSVNSLTSPKFIKGLVLENYFIKRFLSVVEDARAIEISNAKIISLLRSMSEPIGITICMLILYFSLTYFKEPLEYVIVLVIMFYRLYQKIGTLPQSYAGILYYLPLYKMCNALGEEATQAREISQKNGCITFRKSIELIEVSFKYDNSRDIVLSNIGMKIQKGEFIGITGRSGSGKTTLVDMILGLIEPTKGMILVDGKPLEKCDIFSWRKRIGYVCQDNVLYSLSIRENIALGVDVIDEDNMKRAATMANAHEFIKRLPQGYDTVIGERGMTLSGGEKQRIALSQALFRKPNILILDEATSNLDSDSEQIIQKSISDLYGSMTIIAIAHRLKTLADCDRVIVLEKGEIIEEGGMNALRNPESFLSKLIKAGNIEDS